MREPCPDCGAPLGGRAGCEEAWHLLGVRAAREAEVVRTRAMHDAWCLQHPEPYTRSVKSFCVHLLGLCVALEAPTDLRAQAAVWHDIRVPVGAAKAAPPARPPSVTVADVLARPEAETGARFIQAEWARWAHAHGLAREWLEEARRRRR